ncbi:YncE family protein [Kerstersia sp.]|uniref:YncE family protein n=1 Tax=Kerstersia sp. TaxID=1930783 RepID=UPI003F92A955
MTFHSIKSFTLTPRAASLLAAASLALGALAPTLAAADTPAAAATASASPAVTKQVVRKALAPALYEVVYSPRQNAVFVASAGGFGPDAPASRILRLDPDSLAVVAEIPVKDRAFGLALDDANDTLYTGNTLDGSINAIDTRNNTLRGTLQLIERAPKGERAPLHLRELLVDTDKHRLYLPALGTDDSTLFVVDTRDLKLVKAIPGLGRVSTGIALDNGRERLYVVNFEGKLVTIDTNALEIANIQQTEVEQPTNLAYDAAARRLYVTDQGQERITEMQKKYAPGFESRHPGGRVAVLNPDTAEVVGEAAVGKGALGITLDDTNAYSANRMAGTVTVVRRADNAVVSSYALPDHPNSVALDNAGQRLFVTIKNGQEAPKGAAESLARIQLK